MLSIRTLNKQNSFNFYFNNVKEKKSDERMIVR